MLPDGKKTMMYTRLVRRLREFKLADFSAYIKYVESEQNTGKDDELLFIVNAMTTNVTAFFRENHHFEHLTEHLDDLVKKFGEVHIWSCACSSGQEPWSIAMVVGEYLEKNPSARIKIMATDIDTNMVKHGEAGIYKLEPSEVEANPHLKKWFKKTAEASSGIIKQATYEIDSKLRSLVTFKQMNLLKPWTITNPAFHVVFCRNVIIYFSKETQRGLFANIEKKMPIDSLLYIGHSESLLEVSTAYETKGRTIYTKKVE
jgi:chemotaxis protein methyltransferase CheR